MRFPYVVLLVLTSACASLAQAETPPATTGAGEPDSKVTALKNSRWMTVAPGDKPADPKAVAPAKVSMHSTCTDAHGVVTKAGEAGHEACVLAAAKAGDDASSAALRAHADKSAKPAAAGQPAAGTGVEHKIGD